MISGKWIGDIPKYYQKEGWKLKIVQNKHENIQIIKKTSIDKIKIMENENGVQRYMNLKHGISTPFFLLYFYHYGEGGFFMKKKMAMLCAAVIGVSAVLGTTGCGNNGNEELVSSAEDSSAQDTDGKVTKLVFLRAGTEKAKKNYWQEMIEGFEAENPDIDIEYQECPYGDDFETKLNTGFASSTAPDIINFTMASMGTRVPLGQYESLDKYVDVWEGKDDFMENALKLGTINDSLYGLPVFADPRVLIYNKEMFEEAGLNSENPPSNWDELLAAHEKLVKKDGDSVVQTGMGIPTSGSNMHQWFSIFAEENGVKNLVDEDDNSILINTPEAVEAAEYMLKLKELGVVQWDSTNSDQNPFSTGLAAMTFGSDQDFQTWNSGALKDKIAMASPLKNKKQATFCGMGFLFMSGETEHKEEVWRFMEYISSPENMWKRYEELGSAPLRESLKDKFIAENPEINQVIYESISCGNGSPKVPYANSVYNIVNESMEKIMYGVDEPGKSMNDGAKKIQKEVDNL